MTFNKKLDVMETTSSPKVYNRVRKSIIQRETGRCPLCPWNGGENSGLVHNPKRSWKFKSRRRKQYKAVEK